LHDAPTGVIIGTEGAGENLEVLLLLDGFHLAYPFKRWDVLLL
jgi:hypothetical protein